MYTLCRLYNVDFYLLNLELELKVTKNIPPKINNTFYEIVK